MTEKKFDSHPTLTRFKEKAEHYLKVIGFFAIGLLGLSFVV